MARYSTSSRLYCSPLGCPLCTVLNGTYLALKASLPGRSAAGRGGRRRLAAGGGRRHPLAHWTCPRPRAPAPRPSHPGSAPHRGCRAPPPRRPRRAAALGSCLGGERHAPFAGPPTRPAAARCSAPAPACCRLPWLRSWAKGRRERAWARRGTTSAGCSLQIAAAARRVPQTLDRGLAETARVAVVAICSAPGAHKRVWGALAFPSSGTVQLHPAPQLSRRSKATGQSAGARGGLLGRPARWARQPSRAAFERASLQAAPRLPRCPPTAAATAAAAAAACRADCWVDQHTSQPRCIKL